MPHNKHFLLPTVSPGQRNFLGPGDTYSGSKPRTTVEILYSYMVNTTLHSTVLTAQGMVWWMKVNTLHNESHITYIIVSANYFCIHAKSCAGCIQGRPTTISAGKSVVGHDSRDGQSFCIGTIIGSKGWNLGNLGLSSNNICSPLKKTALQINR